MWEAIKAFFLAWSSTNKVVEKALPSEKIQEGKFEIAKGSLTEAEVKKIADKRNAMIDEMFGDLRHHPELSVADKVNYECSQLPQSERDLIIKILTDRLNSDSIYIRSKNKKSKFRL
jgi:ABC-type molybdate transport system ATPase subunit